MQLTRIFVPTASRIALFLAVALALAPAAVRADEASDASPHPQQLPVQHDDQRILRAYLAAQEPQDFALPTDAPFTYDEKHLEDPDNLFRLWLLANDQYGRGMRGLFNLPPEAFTLPRIETPPGIRLRARADLFPASLLFFADWDYPGNPLRGSRAVRNRVFAFCIVDMLCLDALHSAKSTEGARVRRSDFLGGTLAWHALTYAGIKGELPVEVRTAFEIGMGRFVDRLLEWGPRGGLGNMDSMGLVALATLEKVVEDPDLAARSREAARRIVAKICAPAGYVTDGGGTDISYNGLALYHMAWAARLSGWDFLDDAVRRLLRFMSVMTLPDPDGQLWGPSHFSVRTSADAANDQWAFPHRQYGLALGWPELAGYLVFEGRRAPVLPDETRMREQVRRALNGLERARTAPPPDAAGETSLWGPEHFDVRYNWAWSLCQPGDYARLRKAQAERPYGTDVPMRRNLEWTANLADEVILRRTPGYAALVHAGRVGAFHDNLYGLGGGSLSAFWTAAGGSILLGRRRGHQHDNPDRMDEWRIWPVHALSGETRDGKLFTSARVRFPEKTVEPREDGTTHIRIQGTIGDARSAPDHALSAPIEYERLFLLEADGVAYRTRITGAGLAEAVQLFETVPVFIRDARQQPEVTVDIQFVVEGAEVGATTEPVRAEAVRIRRFHGGAEIRFDAPRSIRLSPTVWNDTYQSRAEQRNILIDMLPLVNECSELAFRITPLPVTALTPTLP